MRKLSCFVGTIITATLTLWLLVYCFGLLLLAAPTAANMKLASQLCVLFLVTGAFTCVCHFIESRCTYSTDSVEPTVIGD